MPQSSVKDEAKAEDYNYGRLLPHQGVKLVKVLQKLLSLKPDGKFGPVTKQALTLLDLDDVTQLRETTSPKPAEKTTKVGIFSVKCLQGDLFEVNIVSDAPKDNEEK